MRYVGKQGTHRHHELHVERFCQFDDRRGEGTPAEVRLRSRKQDDPTVAGGFQAWLRSREHVLGPFDLARYAVDQLDLGACGLEIEELFAVEATETPRLPRGRQGPDRDAGRVGGIIPACKAGDENRPLQLGFPIDGDVSYIHGASLPRSKRRSEGAKLIQKSNPGSEHIPGAAGTLVRGSHAPPAWRGEGSGSGSPGARNPAPSGALPGRRSRLWRRRSCG